MKIGIITLFGLCNYGNRLQNLAVTEILQREGYEVETIVCERIKPRTIKEGIKSFLFFNSKENCKKNAFKKFNKQYIKEKHIIRQNLKMPSYIDRQYDAFVVGSDQVWNPEIRKRERDTFFLRFTSPEKRLCISPSIGIEHIDDQYIEDFKNGFNGFVRLSCREEQGSREIRKISGRECTTLIDPTLALPADYWRKIGDYSNLPKNKYIFKFFLSKPKENIEKTIEDYAMENGCDIIDMQESNCTYYDRGPAYFISLIDNAEMVFTDSFHAVAFSVNLGTSFYAFDRFISQAHSNMSSRIYSLLSLLGLHDRFLGFKPIKDYITCNFDHVAVKIEDLRLEFESYIKTITKDIK